MIGIEKVIIYSSHRETPIVQNLDYGVFSMIFIDNIIEFVIARQHVNDRLINNTIGATQSRFVILERANTYIQFSSQILLTNFVNAASQANGFSNNFLFILFQSWFHAKKWEKPLNTASIFNFNPCQKDNLSK